MAKFSNCCPIPNPMPQTPNILLYAATVQDKNIATVVKLDIKVKNIKF